MYIINFFDPTGVVAPQCWKVCTDHVNYSFHLIHRVSDILSWNAATQNFICWTKGDNSKQTPSPNNV